MYVTQLRRRRIADLPAEAKAREPKEWRVVKRELIDETWTK